MLDYGRPPTGRGNAVLGIVVGLLGLCALAFGMLMLFIGVPGIFEVFSSSNSQDFPGDLFEVVMFLLIGIVCVYVAIRWFRAANRLLTEKQ